MKRHGISIGLERTGSAFYLTIKPIGRLTHQDYEMITPMLDEGLRGVANPSIHVLLDGTQLEGWELRAAWDDFKLGLKHGQKFEKVAIVGNKHWQEVAAKVGQWFISGEIRYFEDLNTACVWLEAEIE